MNAAEKLIADVEQARLLDKTEVAMLAYKLNSPVLYNCTSMYEIGRCSWEEAMQIAAVELAKVVSIYEKEIVRLRSESVMVGYPNR